ncbi:MAG TPA: nucleotide exchange factor GrpE, partial [Ktedonobacterales bacterium]|nr:nucleotide exchange factor GrpE [Ktedonobacterales bacterium]
MSEDKHIAEPTPEVNTEANAQANAQTSAPTDAQPGVSGDGAALSDSPEARIAELERLLAAEHDAATDYMQRWQRAAADFTNFRRRAQQEQEQRERLSGAQALVPVLHALDGFERAFAALPNSLRGYSWIEGIALVEAQLRRALEAQEITEVPAEPGQPFDPMHHQAIGEVTTSEHPAGHIAVLLQRGYQVASLLLRPALVQVARAPEAAETSPATEATTSESPAASAAPASPEETQPSGPA